MAIYVCYLLLAGIQVPFFYYKKGISGARCFDSSKYLTLCCIELILLAGFRGYTIGADTETYLKALDYYGHYSIRTLLTMKPVWQYTFETGYFALMKLNILFGLGKTGFLFIVALIIYIPIFVAIKKYSPYPYISILCYFAFQLFGYSLGIFRQMIAISILLCGWRYLVERRFVKYLLVVGLAMLFHTTAIVALALYFLYGVKWKNISLFLPVAEITLLVFGRSVVMFAMKLLPKYAGYVGGQYDIQDSSYTMLLIWNTIFFASIIFSKKENSNEQLAISALILTACLQCAAYSMGIFGRIVPYFSIYTIFAIPNILRNIEKRRRAVVALGVVLCLAVLIFIDLNGNKYVTPYYTVFNGLPS